MSDFEPEEYAEYIDWDFRPYHAVRPVESHGEDHINLRENVYIRHWQRMMTRHAIGDVQDKAIMREDCWFVDNESWRYPILDVFGGITPNAHDTRIASNFILYLGYNNGRSYLYEAEKLSEIFAQAHIDKQEAYLAQWAIENSHDRRRRVCVTGYVPRFTTALTNKVIDGFSPDYEDIKTLESVAYWLGTDEGQNFIQKCDRTLKKMAKRYYPKRTDHQEARRKRLIKTLNI